MRLFFIIVSFITLGCTKKKFLISENEISKRQTDTLQDSSTDDYLFFCNFTEEPSVDLEEWGKYLSDSLVLDDAAMDTIPPGKYTVIVQFEVGEKGKLSDISILNEPLYGLGERVKKVLSNCTGLWKPVREENDQIIRSYSRQPITFVVEE